MAHPPPPPPETEPEVYLMKKKVQLITFYVFYLTKIF